MAGLLRKPAAFMVLASVLLTSAAQLLFRYAMQQDIHPDAGLSLVASILAGFTTAEGLALLLGVVLYGVSMVAWVIALTRYSVSFAYPLLSLSYVLVYVAATQLAALNETVSLVQSVGVVFIVIGVALLAQAKPLESD